MNCIVVDDEPLAREGMQLLIAQTPGLKLNGCFSNADDASAYLADHKTDLVFLDIQMPGTSGIEFARTISPDTLVIFTTAFASYALDSYEVDAIDYLVKPLHQDRFLKAVQKARAYHAMLHTGDASPNNIEAIASDFIFVKAERKFFKLHFKDILYIEGLKDYVVLHLQGQRIITAMNIKTIHEQLPKTIFCRVSKSYIINIQHIESFDNNTVFIHTNEVPIGNSYRAAFFDEVVNKKILSR